jgi:glycosyltransferase involved in cell wall biosynthesis
MKSTNISFIVPAYNCAKFLPEAINSIFDGNFTTGDEVIIIDDASTDDTFKVAKSLQKKHTQIKIFRHHYNKGSAAAGRNTGIDNSINDLIFCLDADNILYPDSIPKLKKYLIDKKADVAAFGELHYFKQNTQSVTNKWIYKKKISLYGVINESNKTPCASGNYLFTKESWLKAGRYNETSTIIVADSWAFGFCQLATGSKMVTLPDSFYYHRYGYESTFVKESRKTNASLVLLQIILPYEHLFDDKDVDYIFSRKGRYVWIDNINKRPLKLKRDKLAYWLKSLVEAL